MTTVSFPGLGIGTLNLSQEIVLFGHVHIHWYGVIIAIALLVGVRVALMRAKRQQLDTECVYDLALLATPVAIIFARLYYVLFNFDLYKANPIKILYIWEGGIAIYGAVIGAVLTVFLYAKIKNINVGNLFDMGCVALILGQAIGRWGNFVNGEAYGVATDLPWRMVLTETFNGAVIQTVAHPTFLYESIWDFCGFLLLWNYEKRKRFHGEVFLLYILWYGIGRAFIEGLRTDSLYLGSIRISQLVAILSAAFAAVLIAIKRKKYKNVPLVYSNSDAKEEENVREASDD